MTPGPSLNDAERNAHQSDREPPCHMCETTAPGSPVRCWCANAGLLGEHPDLQRAYAEEMRAPGGRV